jgi:hypothetical protein
MSSSFDPSVTAGNPASSAAIARNSFDAAARIDNVASKSVSSRSARTSRCASNATRRSLEASLFANDSLRAVATRHHLDERLHRDDAPAATNMQVTASKRDREI